MEFSIKTLINKKIPKQRFYDNLSVPESIKKLFVEQIKYIYWQNKISNQTININIGKNVLEIEVFRIVLNQTEIDEVLLKFIDKGIPYHIIFILEFNQKIRLCTAYKEINQSGSCNIISQYYYTDWDDDKNVQIDITGLTLDSVYEGFVRQIAKDKIANKSRDIKIDVEISQKVEKLNKEIEKLEKQARAEKQPKRKYEKVQQLKKLEKELELLK